LTKERQLANEGRTLKKEWKKRRNMTTYPRRPRVWNQCLEWNETRWGRGVRLPTGHHPIQPGQKGAKDGRCMGLEAKRENDGPARNIVGSTGAQGGGEESKRKKTEEERKKSELIKLGKSICNTSQSVLCIGETRVNMGSFSPLQVPFMCL